MKTRDQLQEEHRLQNNGQGTAVPPANPLADEFYIIDERLDNLEQGLAGKPIKVVRPVSKTVGAILATVNLLSVTAVVWLLLLGIIENREAAITAAIFILLALLGGIIASTKQPV